MGNTSGKKYLHIIMLMTERGNYHVSPATNAEYAQAQPLLASLQFSLNYTIDSQSIATLQNV